MAFSSGNSGGPMSDINVTPLVDVMLVLLIIFMITAPMLSHKIKIDLPQPNPNIVNPENPPDPVRLQIRQDGSLYWNDTPVDELGLRAQIAVIAQQSNQPELQIDADDAVVGEMDDVDLDFVRRGPADRVALFLDRRVYQVIGFGGVMRTDLLRSMGGLPGFYGGDIALGVKMAMRAPWVQVPEQLFVSRRHDQQTNKVQGGDVLVQVRTYDPAWSRPVAFPQWFLNYRILREAATAPVPPRERARAVAQVLRLWTVRNWRFFPFDVKRNLIRLTTGEYVGAYHSGRSGRTDDLDDRS